MPSRVSKRRGSADTLEVEVPTILAKRSVPYSLQSDKCCLRATRGAVRSYNFDGTLGFENVPTRNRHFLRHFDPVGKVEILF